LLLKRLGDFCAQALDKQGPLPSEVSADDVARAGHTDADAIEESAGTCGQDDHPIRQIHRFVDVVCDEDDSLPRALPDVEQEALHLKARLHVEGGKWFIHQQYISPQAQGHG
jgi:hypothetical protein